MPIRPVVQAQQAKRQKETITQVFTNAAQIRQALRSQTPDADLLALRNQLTIKHGEPPLSTQDPRVLLVKLWLDSSPGAQEVFDIWENANQAPLTALCISVLCTLFALISPQFIYRSLGQPIMKTLLSPLWTRRLNSYIGGSHTDLVLVSLKLFNAMSTFSEGKEQRSVLDAFAWDLKMIPKLLFMRRKGKKETHSDMLARPDIRTLYILFILSFVDVQAATPVKIAFLEHRRDAFLAIFKGLAQDPFSVVQKVLEVCWNGLWCDMKIKRSVKVALFNEITFQQLLKLYERRDSDDDDSTRVPADLVHHFLLAVCTRPGVGVCFHDLGWYPRTDTDNPSADSVADTAVPHGKGKIYNKILANVLKNLKVNEDGRQQELALKIFSACPELVAGYWSAAALTLEPRLSSKWIANISFFGSVISLPVPTSSFFLPRSSGSINTVHRPNPPSTSTVLENVFPSVNLKVHLSRGLQSLSGLVQHCTALAVTKCLVKLERVVSAFQRVAEALEEDGEGLWTKGRLEIEKEARRRVPDFQVVVALSQQKHIGAPVGAGGPGSTSLPSRIALLTECAQRLLWLYHRCLPLLVAEARFDVGKLLLNFGSADGSNVAGPNEDSHSGVFSSSSTQQRGLDEVRRLHVLRLLQESDQFVWSGKTGSHSHLYTLLKVYTSTPLSAVRSTVLSLLRHVLSGSILFQHDPDELDIWLHVLPSTVRAMDATAPDGIPLTDEPEGVITFLDECVQRCVKTPYRYIEELQNLVSLNSNGTMDFLEVQSEASAVDQLASAASPLFMTMLEQLTVKSKNGLLSPSNILAVTSYVRKLAVTLMGKQFDLRLQHALITRLDTMFDANEHLGVNSSIVIALRREVSILTASIRQVRSPTSVASFNTSAAVQEFLRRVEDLPQPPSVHLCRISACELIDWLRLIDQPLHSTEAHRLLLIIEHIWKPALHEFIQYLHPNRPSLWHDLDLAARMIESGADFNSLFIQCGPEHLKRPACHEVLVQSVFCSHPQRITIERACLLVSHRLSAQVARDDVMTSDLLHLITGIARRAKVTLTNEDWTALQHLFFLKSSVIRNLCMSSEIDPQVYSALSDFTDACLDVGNPADKALTAEFCLHWVHTFESSMSSADNWIPMRQWIKYMAPDVIFSLLDDITGNADSIPVRGSVLVDDILAAVQRLRDDVLVMSALLGQMSQLLQLRTTFPASTRVLEVIAIALDAGTPSCFDGRHPWQTPPLNMTTIISGAEARWSQRLRVLPKELRISTLLDIQGWTPSHVSIIVPLLYKSSAARISTIGQLTEESSADRLSMVNFTTILHALLDAGMSDLVDIEASAIPWHAYHVKLVQEMLNTDATQETQSICSSCVSLMLELLPSERHFMMDHLKDQLQSAPINAITSLLLVLVCRLTLPAQKEFSDVVDALLDLALQWAVRQFSSDDFLTDEDRNALKYIGTLVKHRGTVKAHLAEPVLTAAIQNRLSEVAVIRFSSAIASTASLKPVAVNRNLQSILQHSQLRSLAHSNDSTSSPLKDVVELLHILFNLHPQNTCQPSHIQPLLQIYSGTLSYSDRQLLSILHLFETQRKLSVASVFRHWSASAGNTSNTSLEALKSLDPARVLRACLAFPNWRRLDHQLSRRDESHGHELYDPVFVVLLFAQMLAEGPPQSAMVWVELFRTNVVCLLIRSLSSKDDALRDIALSQIARLHKCLESADMQEQPLVEYVLNLLKDLVPTPLDTPPPRLTTYTTLILLHALRGIFYPSNFTYPLTARFLLQRPELDRSDVPLLYGMLYSSSDDWKKERAWIIRFLSDGLTSTQDWQVFKGRHTWDLLATLFQSSENNRSLRSGILEVLANITCNSRATTSLVLKSSLLYWIEMQTPSPKVDEVVPWIKILENIVTIVDKDKMEQSTAGEWRAIIGRCVHSLLDAVATAFPLWLLSRVLLKIALLPGLPIATILNSIEQSFELLKSLEVGTQLPTSWDPNASEVPAVAPLHSSYVLHELSELPNVQLWGETVEFLWQVSMTLDQDRPAVWGNLTCRLLLWRSIVREEACPIGEWARKEVVQLLSQ